MPIERLMPGCVHVSQREAVAQPVRRPPYRKVESYPATAGPFWGSTLTPVEQRTYAYTAFDLVEVKGVTRSRGCAKRSKRKPERFGPCPLGWKTAV